MGWGVLWSVCSSFSLLPLSSHTFPLLQRGLPTGDSSFGNIHLLQRGPLRELQGISGPAPWSTYSSCSDLDVSVVASHSFCCLPLSPSSIFCHFLDMFSQRCHTLNPALGLFWSWREPAVSSTEQPLVSSHGGHPCSQHATKTLPYAANTLRRK